jgi:hypothetical protein
MPVAGDKTEYSVPFLYGLHCNYATARDQGRGIICLLSNNLCAFFT